MSQKEIQMSNGSEVAKSVIIRELENVLAEHQVNLLSARNQIQSFLNATESTINKSGFLDDIAAGLREYLSSLEEFESGKVRKREDYVEEQLQKAEKRLQEIRREMRGF